MRKILLLIFLLAFAGRVDAQVNNSQSLKNEIASLEKSIAASKTESGKYEGGMIKTLIDSRTQTLAQTKAMLEQRLKAGNNNIKINYTVNGKPYTPPADKEKILRELEGTALSVTKELEMAKAEAEKYTGGLIQAMKLASVATYEQQLAMLDMKRSALIFDIPLYTFETTPSETSPKKAGKGKGESTNSKIDGMFDLKLVGKHVFEANYSDHLGFNFVFTNNTEKDIKAVQGTLSFTDLFDADIQSMGLTIEKDIPAGQSIENGDYSVGLNQFSEKDNRLKSIDIENLKTKFKTESIIFKDGSIVKR